MWQVSCGDTCHISNVIPKKKSCVLTLAKAGKIKARRNWLCNLNLWLLLHALIYMNWNPRPSKGRETCLWFPHGGEDLRIAFESINLLLTFATKQSKIIYDIQNTIYEKLSFCELEFLITKLLETYEIGQIVKVIFCMPLVSPGHNQILHCPYELICWTWDMWKSF